MITLKVLQTLTKEFMENFDYTPEGILSDELNTRTWFLMFSSFVYGKGYSPKELDEMLLTTFGAGTHLYYVVEKLVGGNE